jgi:hypothetical protein
MSYDGETCEGCVHFADDVCDNTSNWVDSPNVGELLLRPTVWTDSGICDLFKPSLGCRRVRALERLAACTRDADSGEAVLFLCYDAARSDFP